MLMVVLSIGQVWGTDVTYTLTINASDFNTTSYAANNNEKTSNAVCTTDNTKTYEVNWTSNQVMKNGNNMQWQKSKGYIFNSTDLGTISSVTVNSSAGSFTTYYGTSEHPTSGTTVGNGYFTTSVGGATGTTSSIVVTFVISESGGGSTPTLTATPTTIDFGTVDKNALVADKKVAVSFSNLKGSVTYSGLSSPFGATGTIASTGDEITISANTSTVGEYEQTLTIQSATDSKSQEVTVTMNVVEPFDGLQLTFDVSSNPGGWPTTNSTTTTDYTYTLNDVAYTFALNNVKCNSGYLMLTSPAKLGLPAISDYKLVKVEAFNSGGCSTSTKVKITSDEAGESVVKGGNEQTWGTTSSKYTYNLSETDENTMYYLIVSNKNCQLLSLTLYYEESETPSVAKPTITGTDKFLTSSEITITQDEADAIYYTTNGNEPTTSSAQYTAPFSITETTMVKAIAVKGTDVSAVAEATFTKATVMTISQARAAIDAGGDLTNKYVKGIISQIDSYNSSYHSITYWISDDGTTTDQLEVYSGLAGVVKTQFESENDIHVGEEVIVKGTLKKYNSIYEFDKNNTIEAYKSLSPIAWSTNAYTAELGSTTNEFPTLSGTAGLTITYSSSDLTKAEIAQDGTITLHATGETTITASSAATETYVETDVSYTLTIEESVVRVSITFVENGGEPEQTDLTEQTNLPNPLPAIAKAGYNFGGWYTDENFQTLAVAGAEITENTTLYAQWLEPYTVAVALVKIAALPDGEKTEDVYVQGVVTGEVSISGTSASYDIKDASVDNRLAIYKGKGLNGADVTAGDIQDGDQVVVYGKLYKYVKSTVVTPEVAQDNYLYSLDRPTVPVIGVTLPSTASVKVDKTITLTPMIVPSNASNKNVTWSITSGSDYASVNEEGVVTGLAAGEAVIQVTTEDGGYTASCTVTVAEAPDFNDPTHEWKKVTSADKLVAGKYYVLGLAGQAVTATFNLTGGYLGKVASTFTQGAIIAYDALGENTAVFQLGGEAGAWTLTEVMAQDQLLGGYGTANLAWGGENTAWPIIITDGFAVIGDANGNRILYNKTSPRFKTYSSDLSTSMLLPQLFVWGLKSHMVTFDANGGVAESVPEAEPTEDGKITIPATEPTHEDVTKVFVGWYVESAPDVLYKSGDEFATDEDVTLYAKWNTAQTYTVTYVLGGSGTAPEVTYYAVGKKVTIATISDLKNPGYLFSGWTVEDAEHNVLPVDDNGQFTMPNSNVKVIAKWARATNDKWVLVTDVTNLKTDGTEYLIASAEEMTDGKYYAMAEQKSNNRAAVEVMHSEGVIRGSSVLAAFVLEDAENGMFAIKTSDGYLYTAANNNNYLRTQTENNVNGKWTITIEDGVASIVATNSSNRNVMQFNYASNNQIFSCYSSASQKPLAIYEKAPNRVIEDETVNASDLTAGTDVTIKDGGTLTVDGDKQIGDLTVEEGGVVALNNTLTVVGTFTIETTMAGGKSGQLKGANTNNFIAQADAYIDITLGDNGNADKWHAFTVPFPVDALNGIFDLDGNKLTNETNYAIMDYHGDIRAQGKYGWKKFRGTLVPGTFYLMTVDGNRTTYRMKMKAGSNVVADNKKDFYKYAASGEGQATDAGWNGIGNPTLAYGQVSVAVQVLDPVNYVYVTKDANSCNFIVGTPFFYQAAGDGEIPVLGEDNEKPYYAPIRKAVKTTEQIKVSLANENYTDNLFISASEDATADYQVGKDLVKMTMTNTPIVPQIFGVAYKTQLSMVHAPLVGDHANYTLNLYAPADGEYTISAQQTEDAIVYLTYEGSPIWNITAGEYNCDLQKGNNSGFGLMLVRRAPQVTTDIEGANQPQTGVRKLLINGQLFIEKDGKLFNVTGQRL